MSSSAEDLPLAFPPPPPRTPGTPRTAFPPPPPPPVTPATRAFPPAADSVTVRFGESILRDERAGAAPSARFDVDLREREGLPPGLVAQVRAEAEAVGYAEGWAQGRREAQTRAAEQAAQIADETAQIAEMHHRRVERALRTVAAAADELERRALPAAEELEDQIVATAFALAEAVLARELRTATEPGRDALTRALALTPRSRPVTVRLNPADLMTIGQTELFVDGRTVSLVDDPDLQPGDALAICDATTIDARLGPALDRVREVLQQ